MTRKMTFNNSARGGLEHIDLHRFSFIKKLLVVWATPCASVMVFRNAGETMKLQTSGEDSQEIVELEELESQYLYAEELVRNRMPLA